MVVEERPLPDGMAGLQLLRLQVTVHGRGDGHDAGADAAGEEAQAPEDDGHDALRLLADDDVADAADDEEVQDHHENRILRRLLRVDETAATTGRAGRGRGRGWRRRGVRAWLIAVHEVSLYIFSAMSVTIGRRYRSPLSAFMMRMMARTMKMIGRKHETQPMIQPNGRNRATNQSTM